jgi:multidrug efflux pump subunit AcrB
MSEVTGPIISTALVLCAVFIPTAFISGLSGQFYRQFALTIAISTVISAFNSLTLSPALAAVLLKSHDAPKDRFQKLIDAALGWLFNPFNRFFAKASNGYVRNVGRTLGKSTAGLVVYGILLALTIGAFMKTPGGFVPQQDKAYVVAVVQLPDAASLDRTEAVIRQMGDIAMKVPGIKHSVAFPGLSANGFINSPNSGAVFFPLDDFKNRKDHVAVGQRHRRPAERQVRGHSRRPDRGVPAAFGAGAGHDRRLPHADRRPRRPGSRRAEQADPEPDRQGPQGSRPDRRVLDLPGQRAEDRGQHRSREGAGLGRVA